MGAPSDDEPICLRLAEESDAPALAAIYAPIVEQTHISFELVPPDPEEMARRIRAYGALAPYLVCVEGGTVLGYAYAAPFRPRPAYRFSVETSVYVAAAGRRRGVASALYRALLAALREQGFVTVIAGISLPNEASIALHERLGFRSVARLPSIGHKFETWHDVGYWALPLCEPPGAPCEPIPPLELVALPEILERESTAIRRES